jgi:hypothetical protein
MKTKVICGRKPATGDGKTKKTLNSWAGNRGVVVSSRGRRSSMIIVALKLIARKLRAKE